MQWITLCHQCRSKDWMSWVQISLRACCSLHVTSVYGLVALPLCSLSYWFDINHQFPPSQSWEENGISHIYIRYSDSHLSNLRALNKALKSGSDAFASFQDESMAINDHILNTSGISTLVTILSVLCVTFCDTVVPESSDYAVLH